MANGPLYTVADHVTLWITDGAIHIKTRDPYGDPVELAEHDAEELVEVLSKLIAELKG